MTAQAPVKRRGRRPATRQVYPFYRRTTTGERVKVVKRWLCPLDPTFCTFYSVDAEDRFWQEKKGEYSPAEAPPELVERHEKWKRARTQAWRLASLPGMEPRSR